MPRLRTLEICGFRSFATPQALSFDTNLGFVWASNSQGKTSIAEAVEFLITGTTNRRELLGGAKAEFDSSLRNVHIAADAPVWVKAEIEDDAGVAHHVCRELVSDYTAELECVGALTIDGVAANDLNAIGIALFDAPLRAPVLLQHSLRFALSAKPSDRADYFKSLLGVQDLDLLSQLLGAQVSKLQPAASEITRKMNELSALDGLSTLPSDIESSDLSAREIERHLAKGIDVAVAAIGAQMTVTSGGLSERAVQLEQALDKRREQTFPVHEYAVGGVPTLPEEPFAHLHAYSEHAQRVDAEVETLRKLFEAVLDVPAVAHAGHTIDCPVCESPHALTTGRVEAMRTQVSQSKELRQAQADARAAIHAYLAKVTAAESASARLLPSATTIRDAELAKREALVIDLIGSADLHKEALQTAAQLAAAKAVVDQALRDLRDGLEAADQEVAHAKPVDCDALVGLLATARTSLEALTAARARCSEALGELLAPIRSSVDTRQGISQWRKLAEVATDAGTLRSVLRDNRGIASVRAELQHAQNQIDNARLQVFNEKFDGMSDEITRWWQLLRPDEPVHFEAVKPRGAGKRFVSFKVRLRPQLGALGVVRDALGVFSDSQLNALGLAAFLARTKLQESPLVVLDDPLQAGDSDHRATFVVYVLQELLDLGVQVIVLSFDDMLRKLLHNRYEALPIDGFVVTLENPSDGSVVAKISDTADALLQQASVHLVSDHPAVRRAGSQAVRVAGERVAKEILVKERSARGEICSLEDYEGETLGPLIIALAPYLTDRADLGKWKTVNTLTSPAHHDSAQPTRTDLKVALGDLRKFYKTYIRDKV